MDELKAVKAKMYRLYEKAERNSEDNFRFNEAYMAALDGVFEIIANIEFSKLKRKIS